MCIAKQKYAIANIVILRDIPSFYVYKYIFYGILPRYFYIRIYLYNIFLLGGRMVISSERVFI